MQSNRIGLVLSGGGAKGAYHVGVLKALLELDVRIDAIAGASIGALNGAVLASAPSLPEGVRRLEEVWQTMADSPPLAVKVPHYLVLLTVSGLTFNAVARLTEFVDLARSRFGVSVPEPVQRMLDLNAGVLSETPLRKLMDRYLDTKALERGLPLYVSVFRSEGALIDLLSCLKGELGLGTSRDSDILHIQSLSMAERREALLASAAIPLLFAPKRVNDVLYTDGGQGGWARVQGNTPVAPLLRAGCKTVIVTHVSDGSLWNREEFPNATILEIRPRTPIRRDGGLQDTLGFDASKIPSWIQQGYEDTRDTIDRVAHAAAVRAELQTSRLALLSSESDLDTLEQELSAAMARLESD